MVDWTPKLVSVIVTLRAKRMTFEQIAKETGLTFGQVTGAHYRHVRGIKDTRTSSERSKVREGKSSVPNHHNLIEPWAQYTARKKAERAAAKRALSEVISVGQEPD